MNDSGRSDENNIVYDNNIHDNVNYSVHREDDRESMASRTRERSVPPKKKKRMSKTAELGNKLGNMESRFDAQFTKLFSTF